MKIGEYSRIFPSFSWEIFGHVMCLDQLRTSENIWWIIKVYIHSVLAILKCALRGAGQEVGRSCHILEFKGKKVMVRMLLFSEDTGLHVIKFPGGTYM